MGRRTHATPRCPVCRLHLAQCACDALPTLDVATRLVLVAHRRELSKTTATGPLALPAVSGSALYVHGHQRGRLDLTPLHDGSRRVLVLFPADDARVLSAELLAEDDRPVTLIVPEGTWRQASKMVRRLPGLAEAEPVVLPAGPPTAWGLRREPVEGGLATLEAIARALGVLEGREVQGALERWFARIVAGTEEMRQPSG